MQRLVSSFLAIALICLILSPCAIAGEKPQVERHVTVFGEEGKLGFLFEFTRRADGRFLTSVEFAGRHFENVATRGMTVLTNKKHLVSLPRERG